MLLPYRDEQVRALVLEMQYRRNASALALGAEIIGEVLLALSIEVIGIPLLIPALMHEHHQRERSFN
ncbi:MAG: hypothetical protein ACREGH_03660 [Minisyncoccia bacterium]